MWHRPQDRRTFPLAEPCRRRRRGLITGLATWMLLWGGCVANRSTPARFAVMPIATHDRNAAFSAAKQALIDEGYRLDRVDSASGVITTRPITVSSMRAATRRGGRLSTPRRTRRVAEVRLMPIETGFDVYCRVTIQRQSDEAYKLFSYESTSTDLPTDTAIDRGAATTVEQNTVWRIVRRATSAERRIFEKISDRLRTSKH